MKWLKRSSLSDIEKLATQFAESWQGEFNIDTQHLQTIQTEEVPTLKISDKNVTDTDIVETFSKSHDCIATVFVKQGNEFIRIATTVRQRDGNLALGTHLDHDNPAYNKNINGEHFADIVNLFGIEYFTQYDPIFDSQHNLIGILFVGLRRKSFREARAFQICMVFSVAIFAQLITQNPHVAWIGFTVMLIYAGFTKGASLQRTRERVFGVIFGLFMGYFIWVLGQIDYRFVIFIVPILVFMTFFFVGRSFVYLSAFIVALSVLGVDYYRSGDHAIANFLFDYLVFTLIAFAICVVFDHMIFKKENLTRKFYFDLQEQIMVHLNELFKIVTQAPVRRGHYLKESNQFNVRVLDLYTFIDSTKYDIQNKMLADESVEFRENMQKAYHNIRRLFLGTGINEQLILETKALLEALEKSVYST